MVQQSIYDLVERKKHEGMELSYRNSDSVWRNAVNERIADIRQTHETFTSDDIITYLDEQGIVTADNRALGAILIAHARAGLIESTRTQVKCKRKKRHHGYVTLWRVKNV